MYEVLPGLCLGSLAQLEALAARVEDMIVNCTKNLNYDRPCQAFYRIGVDDDLSPESQQMMLSNLIAIVPAIHAALERGQRVLVHCKQGQQRSACVVAAYIIAYHGTEANVARAVDLVRSKKRDAFLFRINFEPALTAFANHLQSKQTA